MKRGLAAQASLLALAIVVGTVLRFDALGRPCYWLDEILGETLTTQASAQPWWHWLTGLDREHGPLYYALQLASRLLGSGEVAGRAPAAVFGLATIPLVWLAARAFRVQAAAVAALLLAVSPLHVYYSREARPYALLMFLTAALLAALLLEARPVIPALLVVAMLYTSATAAPVIAAAAVAAGLSALAARGGRRDWMVALTAVLVLFCVPLLYRGEPWSPAANSFPGFDRELATSIFRGLTVSALGSDLNGRTMIALLLAALIGAIALARSNRRAAVLVLSMTLLPAAFSLASLRWFGHWFAIRYVAPSVIGLLVLAGAGIVATCHALAQPLARKWPHVANALAMVLAFGIVAAVATKTWPAARREPFQKLDWRAIAEVLERRVKSGDVIVMAEPYSYLSLRHYMNVPPNVHFVLPDLVPVAEHWVRRAPAAWLVTAGYSTPISQWMCRYPMILASPLEGFRLHYAPSRAHFLAERSTAAERHAVSTALGSDSFTLRFRPEDELFLGEGWAGADVTRWATGLRATVTIPRGPQRDRVIRFHAYPLTRESLPPQTMRVSLNDAVIANLTLAPEWRDYEVAAPAASWRDGMNRLTLDFARATAPSAVDPASTDHRKLSTTFDRISIVDAGHPPPGDGAQGPQVVTIRAGADRFLDEATAWRGTPTRLPAARLRREAVERLLARLGYDPAAAWPRLARGEVSLDDVVETIAYGGDCEDHASFVQRAFAILLERPPSEGERTAMLARLASNPSRVAVVGRIAKSAEFRGEVLAP